MALKIEVSSENDLEFFYSKVINENSFYTIKARSDLSIEWQEFIPMMKKLIEQCADQYENKDRSYKCRLTMDDDNGDAFLRFYMDTAFKKIELLEVVMRQLSDEDISKQVAFRINSLKQ